MTESEQQPERCETCRFYRVVELDKRKFRQCHRLPPVPLASHIRVSAWPDVSPKDWCGEYKPADSA